MRTWFTSLGVGMVIAAAACGGNVSGGSQDPDPQDPEPSDAPPKTEPDAPAKTPGTGNFGNADTELGPCTLGPLVYETDGAPCAWLADNRCYAERSMACNCACPRERDSQCTSGFDEGPQGRVVVECY
jgi:hypothetical protein